MQYTTPESQNFITLTLGIQMIGIVAKFLRTSFFLTMCLVSGHVAEATTQTILTVGGWSAYSGTSDDGTQLCGIMTQNTDDSQLFFLKYFLGTTILEADVIKTSWSIPDGTNIPMSLTIGTHTPWTMIGRGSGREVTWKFSSDVANEFQKEFEFSNSMELSFQSGTEAPWTFDLSGSYAVFQAFYRCVATITSPPQPTQPYTPQSGPNPAQPSQPFNPGPAPQYYSPQPQGTPAAPPVPPPQPPTNGVTRPSGQPKFQQL